MSARTVAPSGVRRLRARALLALVLLAAACLTETTGPQPGLATFIRDLAGNTQQGTVGAPLAQPIGVTVVDLNGDPVQGVTVQWTTEHGIVASQNGGATDASGVTRAIWTLGPVAGQQVASAAIPDVGSVQFTVQALADRPAHIIALPDTLRFAALADVVPIEVTVTDRFDNVIVAPAVTLTVLDTAIARVTAASAIESRANGATLVEVRADTAVTLVRVLVQQLSAGVVIQTGDIVLDAIADTARMNANAVDANGHPVPVATIVWRSLAPTVATIDDSGLVRTLATGSTAIVAEVPGAADTVFVRVDQAATQLTMMSDRSTVNALGDTALFSAAVTDRNGFAIDSATVLWQSLDPSVVEVAAPGIGVARAPGTARIVAHSGAVADTAVIDVVQIAATVSITNAPDTLVTGDLLQLTAAAADSNGAAIVAPQIAWSSAGGAVTVSPAGLLTGAAPGTALVTATAAAAVDTIQVVVVEPDNGGVVIVTVSPDGAALNAFGDTIRLSAAVTEDGVPTGAPVAWVTLDGAVVVDVDGLVTGSANGTARVVASSGGAADTVLITVLQVTATLALTPALDTLSEGAVVVLSAVAADSNGFAIVNPGIAWSSSDEEIAAVDDNGQVTGAALGTATITAVSDGVVADATIVVVADLYALVRRSDFEQTGTAGETLPDALLIQAYDTHEMVVPGVVITWSIVSGGGSLSEESTITDASGYASVLWTLGPEVGTQVARASADGVDPVDFFAIATAPAGRTRTWTGGDAAGPTDWSNANNWSPAGVPTSSDTVIIGAQPNQPVLTARAEAARVAVGRTPGAGATLTLAGHTLEVFGDFSTEGSNGLLVMRNALDSLLVAGNADFAGRATLDSLTAGVIRLRGDFRQIYIGSNWGSFAASDAHKVILDGAAAQSVTFVNPNGAPGQRSFFRHVEIANTAGGVSFDSEAFVEGDLAVTTATTIAGAGPLRVLGSITTVAGSSITPGGIQVNGAMAVSGSFSPGTTMLGGSGQIMQPGLGYQAVQVLGRVHLGGRTSASSSVRVLGPGSTIDLNGHTFEIAGDFTTEGSHGLLVMRNALDSLLVAGDADFAGRAALDSLTAGVIRLRGDFRQTYIGSNWGSFAASDAHKVILDGAAAQSVTFVNPNGAPGQRSFFRHVEIANTAGGVSFDSEAFVEGDLAVTTATTIAGAGPLRVLGSITTVAGSSITPGGIQVNGAMAVNGSFSPGTTMLGGSGQIMQPGLGYQAVQVLGRVHLGGRTNASSVRVLSPGSTIDLNGHTFDVAGDFSTEGSHGLLVMRNALDSLLVAGDADFAGRTALDSLTAGVIRLRGDFRQTYIGGNWGSFRASGTHRVVMFDENPKTIHFDNPTGAPTQRSFFQDLELDNAGGDLTFTNAAVVTGRLTENVEGTHAIAGTGGALTVGEPQVHDFGFRNLPLVVNGIGEVGLRHVFFADMSTSATQFTVVHPGAATAFVLDSVGFMTLADTDPGRYVFADDADDNATPALSLVLGPDPGNGALKTGTDGVAQVTWTGAPAGGLTRTWIGGGAGSPSDWDWFNPGNWSPAGVPGEADTVVIGAVPMAPVLNGTARVARVHITGILTLSEAALVADVLNEGTLSTNPATTNSIAGNIDNRGPIIVVGSLAVLNSGRTFTTTAGTINFAESDTLTVAGGTIRTGSGSEMLGSGLVLVVDSATLVLESDFSTGEPEWETVNITVEGPGVLSVGEQLSTYGGTFDTDVVVNGSFDIEDGTTTINGTLANRVDGSLQIDADTDTTLLILPAGFTNEGYFSMDGSSGARSLLRLLSGTLVNAPGATIEIESDATIDAPLDNRGDLLITDTLVLQNEGRTFNMTAGVVTLEQDGALEVNGGTVRVGEDGGLLRFNGQGFPIRLLGSVNLIAETDFTIGNGGPQWHFTGTVTVDGPGMFINRSGLTLTGDIVNAHLRNSRTLIVGAGDTSRINGTFENFGDDGNGFFIDSSDGPAAVVVAAGFTNEGAIALRGTEATLAMTAGVLVNNGSVEVGSGAATVIGEIDNQNRIMSRGDLVIARSGANHVSSGTIELENGTVTFGGASLTSTETGNVFGPGTLDVSGLDFTNAGHMTPGFGTRLITIDGALTDAATASLTTWIGGPPAQPELSDRIVVTGTAALTGTLSVELFAGYTPVAGDSWTILTAQSVTGTFTTVNLPVLAGGLEFVVTYSAISVVLTVAPPP